MRYVLFLCGLVLLPLPVCAQAPQVTGATVQGGMLTLAGTGFGSHADYGGPQTFLNAAWNDFASAINGGNLALDGTNNAAWTYERSGGRSPSKPWVKKTHNLATAESIRRLGALALEMNGTTGTFYSTFYLRCGPNIDQAAKFWRIYGTNSQNVFLSFTDMGRALMAASSAAGTPASTTVWGSATDPPRCQTQWQRWEIYLRDSAGDFIQVDVDGVMAFRRGSQLPSLHRDKEGSTSNEREQWIPSPWGGNGHTIDFGHLVDGGFWGFSDAFVDFTRARVELSDRQTWLAARHKEIQVPMQWSDTRATMQLNPGTFQSGQTVYAYVVHANGSVNAAGFPVVIR